MNPNSNNQTNQDVTPQQTQPVAPVYTESKSAKILRKTGTVVATAGMIAGIISTVKSLFRRK